MHHACQTHYPTTCVFRKIFNFTARRDRRFGLGMSFRVPTGRCPSMDGFRTAGAPIILNRSFCW
jgi:hypothetical protein